GWHDRSAPSWARVGVFFARSLNGSKGYIWSLGEPSVWELTGRSPKAAAVRLPTPASTIARREDWGASRDCRRRAPGGARPRDRDQADRGRAGGGPGDRGGRSRLLSGRGLSGGRGRARRREPGAAGGGGRRLQGAAPD